MNKQFRNTGWEYLVDLMKINWETYRRAPWSQANSMVRSFVGWSVDRPKILGWLSKWKRVRTEKFVRSWESFSSKWIASFEPDLVLTTWVIWNPVNWWKLILIQPSNESCTWWWGRTFNRMYREHQSNKLTNKEHKSNHRGSNRRLICRQNRNLFLENDLIFSALIKNIIYSRYYFNYYGWYFWGKFRLQVLLIGSCAFNLCNNRWISVLRQQENVWRWNSPSIE